MDMILASPKKARKFFTAKMDFTTGPIELNEMIKANENINIIDVRLPDDYTKGHIPNAINLPKDKWDTFEGLSREKNNIIYCYSEVCHLAAAAAKHFAENDYPVMELQGGFQQWQTNNMPIET
jgi:rhodanese-related sulfurtransferase